MREWVLYKDTLGRVINNAPFNAENVRIEYIVRKTDKEVIKDKMWVPVAECTPLTKEVADIILSNA